jgi:hypothetical protein
MTKKRDTRRDRMPTMKAIVTANKDTTLRRIDYTPEMALRQCWACSAETGEQLQRAHVVAVCHGGSNEPGNFYLLCWVCHREQPDGAPADVQLEWLASHESQMARMSRLLMPILAWISRSVVDVDLLEDTNAQNGLACLMKGGVYDPEAKAASSHPMNELSTKLWVAARKFVDSMNNVVKEPPSAA